MVNRVFVKVVGFSDVERHALNTVFRLSELRETAYCLWAPEAPEPPSLALFDEQSYEAPMELASMRATQGPQIIWVGDSPPPNAWRTFNRPLNWARVVQAMDELYGPPPDLDLELELGPDTRPPEPEAPVRRAMVVNGDRDERLYLRAKLALHNLLQVDDAVTAAEARALLLQHPYDVILVDLALPDADGWALVAELSSSRPGVGKVFVTAPRSGWLTHLRARYLAGANAGLGKPLDPERLQKLLRRV